MSRHNRIYPFLTFFGNREKIIDSLALSLLDEMQTVHVVVLEPVSCQEHLITKICELMVVLRVVSSYCCRVPEFFEFLFYFLVTLRPPKTWLQIKAIDKQWRLVVELANNPVAAVLSIVIEYA